MRLRIALALLAATIPSVLSAESWKEVDRLPGDIAVELDEDSVGGAMDGANDIVLATFRRHMPTGVMESDLSIDCANEMAKLRGMRLLDGESVYNAQVAATAEFHPVNYGSADAIYFKALCGRDIATPPEALIVEDEPAAGEVPAEDAAPAPQDAAVEEGGE